VEGGGGGDPSPPVCSPSWQCDDWGICVDGTSTRSCNDVNSCGSNSNKPTESQSCICTPNFVCGVYGECNYIDSVGDILTGEISLTGTRDRDCIDLNGCSPNYEDSEQCSSNQQDPIGGPIGGGGEEIKIPIAYSTTTGSGGESIFVIKNAETDEPITKIDLDALEEGRLEISFVQGEDVYPAFCFNAIQDEDETGIDCGGSCSDCKSDILGLFELLPILSLVALVASLGVFFSSGFRKFRKW